MTKRPPSAPPRRSASGINLVITAASLAGTLGGWVLLTVNDRTVTQAVAAVPPAIVQPVGDEPPRLALAPLPTLVPRRERARAVQPAPRQPAANQRRAAPAAPAAPQQRVPAALPAPAAQTRSSR